METIKGKTKNELGENLVYEVNRLGDSSKPKVLILHAFTGKKENKTINYLAKNLPSEGYTTIQFDFSGHGKSEGNMEDATVSKQLKDIQAIIKEVEGELIVVGNSFSVITALAFSRINKVKGLILLCGRAKYLDYINGLVKEDGKYKIFEGFYIGENFVEDYKKYDPLKLIESVDVPVLIVHGEKDEVVPLEEAKLFYNKTKMGELKVIENADHRFIDVKFKEEVLESVISFLKKLV
jgi:esterase/lipase|tara:strand:+ start:273 stop:983 length:711 start_codon:yes stop_codon:yes gene_type:complete